MLVGESRDHLSATSSFQCLFESLCYFFVSSYTSNQGNDGADTKEDDQSQEGRKGACTCASVGGMQEEKGDKEQRRSNDGTDTNNTKEGDNL